jgi:hypothetical protein
MTSDGPYPPGRWPDEGAAQPESPAQEGDRKDLPQTGLTQPQFPPPSQPSQVPPVGSTDRASVSGAVPVPSAPAWGPPGLTTPTVYGTPPVSPGTYGTPASPTTYGTPASPTTNNTPPVSPSPSAGTFGTATAPGSPVIYGTPPVSPGTYGTPTSPTTYGTAGTASAPGTPTTYGTPPVSPGTYGTPTSPGTYGATVSVPSAASAQARVPGAPAGGPTTAMPGILGAPGGASSVAFAPPAAPPAKRRRGLVIGVAVTAVVVVALAAVGITLMLNTGGKSFPVGSCVKQQGTKATKVDCSSSDAYSIVSRVNDRSLCPDTKQPFVVLHRPGDANQVLCLKPAH